MTDTIAAIATAPGQGGVSIVRISGPDAQQILLKVFRPAGKNALPLQSHLMTYGRVFCGDETIDECMAVLMRAPRSYTREDVAELQLHGGVYLTARVLQLCLDAGARLAEPGEFTRRAFLNGRIDLSQAEAVMQLIAVQGEQARKAAVRQLQGGASGFVRRLADELYSISAGIAACVDYPEEISEEEAAADALPRILQLADEVESACDERAARLLNQGLQTVLCGRPNVGKSSLLNALLEEDRAIVTNVPGTTRDIVHGDMTIGGCRICLTDTAGIRETEDEVERIGVKRSAKAMDEAELILAVVDASAPLTEEDRAILQGLDKDRAVLVMNKCDLPCRWQEADLPQMRTLRVSAREQASLAPLKALLLEKASVPDRMALTQPRHMASARRAAHSLRAAAATLRDGLPVDMCTVDLNEAAQALGEITGDQVDEKLLDAVFSQFCVGK
ncbi:MAG: tRNA uridine-5-carboxymethylaminomethyl(34) synthesis GTPase MnmE [Clostridia bacterium]|nr:tRNA uridine-5-carboxymethylaminomethyl(34) synthesis GTPase MnmE [Clostridia bacterium]